MGFHEYRNLLAGLDNIPPEGDPRPFYAFWLSFFMELEGRFLRENAAKKEMVRETDAE